MYHINLLNIAHHISRKCRGIFYHQFVSSINNELIIRTLFLQNLISFIYLQLFLNHPLYQFHIQTFFILRHHIIQLYGGNPRNNKKYISPASIGRR